MGVVGALRQSFDSFRMAQVWPAEISAIARTLTAAGYQAYLVGGAVRDRLLGLPLHDFDITTDARPDDLSRLFPDSELVGAHFGVVLLRRRGLALQLATFRSESSYRDGRHPEAVVFETDPRADVLRRDFTINALLEDPLSGEVLDFVGGRADLEARLIRAVGPAGERFAEDHLRMLRAVRFAARLGFEIEPGTLAAIGEQAPSIGRISAERVRDELVRILTEGQARRGLALLDESGLLKEILPEVSRLKGVAQPPEFHPEGDVWVHTLGLLDRLREPTLELALAALLHDVGKPDTQVFADRIRFNGHDSLGARMSRQILSRLRFSNETIDRVASLVGQHMMFKRRAAHGRGPLPPLRAPAGIR